MQLALAMLGHMTWMVLAPLRSGVESAVAIALLVTAVVSENPIVRSRLELSFTSRETFAPVVFVSVNRTGLVVVRASVRVG